MRAASAAAAGRPARLRWPPGVQLSANAALLAPRVLAAGQASAELSLQALERRCPCRETRMPQAVQHRGLKTPVKLNVVPTPGMKDNSHVWIVLQKMSLSDVYLIDCNRKHAHLEAHWAVSQFSMTPRRARFGERWRLRSGAFVQGSCLLTSTHFMMDALS